MSLGLHLNIHALRGTLPEHHFTDIVLWHHLFSSHSSSWLLGALPMLLFLGGLGPKMAVAEKSSPHGEEGAEQQQKSVTHWHHRGDSFSWLNRWQRWWKLHETRNSWSPIWEEPWKLIEGSGDHRSIHAWLLGTPAIAGCLRWLSQFSTMLWSIREVFRSGYGARFYNVAKFHEHRAPVTVAEMTVTWSMQANSMFSNLDDQQLSNLMKQWEDMGSISLHIDPRLDNSFWDER